MAGKLLSCYFLLFVVGIISYAHVEAVYCKKSGACCPKEGETCCSTGCCPANFTECCPNGRQCCSTGYPNCCGTYCCPMLFPHCCSDSKCCRLSSGLKSPQFFPEGKIVPISDSSDETIGIKYLRYVKRLSSGPYNTYNVKLSGPCNSYDVEKGNEGYYKHVYRDPIRKIPTIGVGFNLEKDGARAEIKNVLPGVNFDALLNGTQNLTDSQIEKLFTKDMTTAVECGSSWLTKWSCLGTGPQSALADMAFNMGCAKLAHFVEMKAALEKKPIDFQGAAAEMKNSLWCSQVKSGRCNHDMSCMEQGPSD